MDSDCFRPVIFYGKRNGIDIRKYGSGNAGTTNALRTLGKKAGAITLAGDCLKAILAILLVSLIFGRAFPEQIMLLKLYAGAGCVLGHNFPFYMNFKGGKGIAASVGMLIAFDWRLFFLCAVVFFTVFFLSHFVSLASLLAYFFFLSLLMSATMVNAQRVITASGKYITKNIKVTRFDQIYLKGSPTIEYTQSPGASEVQIAGSDNLVDLVECRVEGSTLIVNMKSRTNISYGKEGRLKILVSSPMLKSASLQVLAISI